MLDVTLRRIADSEGEEAAEQESEGDWWIDLTASKHKTSRFYGPAMTRISDLVAPLIDRWLESKARIHQFEFEYNAGQYLFSTGSDHRAYSISQWTAAIKAAFGRHSPNGERPPPKLLRSSFITMLRSSERTPSLLKSAAGVMKHAISTSESDVYDKVPRHDHHADNEQAEPILNPHRHARRRCTRSYFPSRLRSVKTTRAPSRPS
mmetsp:Transcript_7594/g.19446  ORF Transcript_7594/g.19446 Transcript_7594/m.19446 type:complete len:206 (-) Transcript_7594:110-727(-)